MLDLTTLIVTKDITYLQQAIDSSVNPLIVYDGIEPFTLETCHRQCNVGRPSSARNVGLKAALCEFVQFLDSDDFLHNNYYDVVIETIKNNPESDLFYTDYNVLNQDFDFDYSYREYLTSPSSFSMKQIAHKIRNPIIRLSALKNKRFDESLPCFEMVDMMYQMGYKKMFHIPQALQTVRIHSKCHERLVPGKQKAEALDIINGRLHGKV